MLHRWKVVTITVIVASATLAALAGSVALGAIRGSDANKQTLEDSPPASSEHRNASIEVEQFDSVDRAQESTPFRIVVPDVTIASPGFIVVTHLPSSETDAGATEVVIGLTFADGSSGQLTISDILQPPNSPDARVVNDTGLTLYLTDETTQDGSALGLVEWEHDGRSFDLLKHGAAAEELVSIAVEMVASEH